MLDLFSNIWEGKFSLITAHGMRTQLLSPVAICGKKKKEVDCPIGGGSMVPQIYTIFQPLGLLSSINARDQIEDDMTFDQC